MLKNFVKLINCDKDIIEAILRNHDLHTLLGYNIADGWNSFGKVAFQFSLEHIEKDPESQKWFTYLAIDTNTNTLLGNCGFKGRPDKDGNVEIGYEIALAFRNKGYATEITCLLTEIAFKDANVKSVIAHTLAEENASGSVLRKNGFIYIKELYDDEDGTIWQWKKSRPEMQNYPVFETDRLLLRPTSEEDAAFVVALLNSPKWLQYIGDRKIYNEEAAKQYINEKIRPQLERLGYSNNTVIKKSDGTKIGVCGLYDREGLEGIDFAFLPEYEKQGYAFESASRILQAARENFGLDKISGITIKENKDSQKLLEKLRFSFQKIIRIPNDDEDLMLYQIHF